MRGRTAGPQRSRHNSRNTRILRRRQRPDPAAAGDWHVLCILCWYGSHALPATVRAAAGANTLLDEIGNSKRRRCDMLTRWQPVGNVQAEMERLHREMNQLFGRFDRGWSDRPRSVASFPLLNLWDDNEALYVEAELPGMDLNDLEIYVNGTRELSIQGERKAPEAGQGTWHRQERGFGKFHRVCELPTDVDADKVEASLTNGLLTLKLPKREEAKPRKISVRSQ